MHCVRLPFDSTVDLDFCFPNPCLNGGICRDMTVGYMCECSEQFSGQNCEIGLFNLFLLFLCNIKDKKMIQVRGAQKGVVHLVHLRKKHV